MKYIDKTKGKAWAHAILKNFLDRYSENGIPFPQNLYDRFRDDRNDGVNTFQVFSENILHENECRCCYCMRTIRKNEFSQRYPLTLEHVVLNSVENKDEYDRYFELPSELENEDMILTSDFLKQTKVSYPPFPHRIAYENLIPSCMGTFPGSNKSLTCNNKRSNEFVPPLVFRKKIEEEIIFYHTGEMVWTKETEKNGDYKSYINTLGLNDINLMIIRCMWYYLSTENLDCNIENREHILRVIDAEIDDDNEQGKLLLEKMKLFKKDEYWNLLKDFKYFNNKYIFKA